MGWNCRRLKKARWEPESLAQILPGCLGARSTSLTRHAFLQSCCRASRRNVRIAWRTARFRAVSSPDCSRFSCLPSRCPCRRGRMMTWPRASAASRMSAASCSWRRRTRRSNGSRSASTIRSRTATISGWATTVAPKSTSASASSASRRNTSLHLSRLDDANFALYVAQGQVILRVRVLEPGETARIDTPNSQIALTRPGLYRIEVSRGPAAHAARRARRRGGRRHRHGRAAGPAGPERDAGRRRAALCATAQRRDDRRLRHLERQPRPPLRSQSRQCARVAADGRLCGPGRIRRVGHRSRVRRGLVSGQRRGRLGAVSQWLLDRSRRVGSDVGRCRALGLRAVPLRPLGAHPRPLGMVSGRLRGEAGLGARARRLGRRAGVARLRRFRRADLRLGAAGLGRGLPSALEGLLGRVLGALQQTVRGESRVRRNTPPERYANSSAPGGLTAVPAPAIAGRRPVASNLVAVSAAAPSASAPVLAAPSVRPEIRQSAGIKPGNGMPAPASVSYAPAMRTPRTASQGGATAEPRTDCAGAAASRFRTCSAPRQPRQCCAASRQAGSGVSCPRSKH